jgi:hypothetical protein
VLSRVHLYVSALLTNTQPPPLWATAASTLFSPFVALFPARSLPPTPLLLLLLLLPLLSLLLLHCRCCCPQLSELAFLRPLASRPSFNLIIAVHIHLPFN